MQKGPLDKSSNTAHCSLFERVELRTLRVISLHHSVFFLQAAAFKLHLVSSQSLFESLILTNKMQNLKSLLSKLAVM